MPDFLLLNNYRVFIKLSYIKFVYVFGETSDKGLSMYFCSEIINSISDSINILCVAVNGNFIGYIEFDFEVKKDIRQCVDSLRFASVKNIAIFPNFF